MGTNWRGGGYSATVDLYLRTDDEPRIDVWATGPDFFRLKAARTLPPKAVLVTTVDDSVEELPITIADGDVSAEEFRYCKVD